MPIDIQCPHCGRKFRVPDKYAGKRVKCPKCEGTIEIPAAQRPPPEEPAPKEEAAAGRAGTEGADTQRWYLQTEDGQQFGPASREELDAWFAEGRITSSCQLLAEGWDQWKWAQDIFAELAEPAPETPPAAEENPFAGIGEPVAAREKEVNPYVSPREPSGGFGVAAEPSTGTAVTPRVRTALAQTRPWVLFLAILGFIGGGLMVLGGLVMGVAGVAARGPMGAGMGGIQGLMFLIMAALYLAPSYFLLRYGQEIGRFLRNSGIRELERAITAQKSFWKLVGMITLILMALYAVMIVVVIVAGIALR